jgi:alpha-1,6-mannosyltransferase
VRAGLTVCGFLLLAGTAGGLWAQYAGDRHLFIAVALGQGAVYAGAVALTLRGGSGRQALLPILAVALLLRALALAAPVFLSNDIYRYIWDGRVAAHGINPYRYIPDDPHLAALRDAVVFPGINRATYAHTIYPPAAQMLFLAATRFDDSVLAMKSALVAAEAVGIAALLFVLRRQAGAPPERIIIYAWHPLPVWEIAGSGHVDAAVVAFVALALAAAAAGRRAWSGAALAAAVLVKFLPLALGPALWRPRRGNAGDWRFAAGFAAVAVLAYLPYLGVGWRVFGFLPGYLEEERLVGGGGFWLVDAVSALPAWAYAALALLVMAGLGAAALARGEDRRLCPRWAAALGVAVTLAISPHYAWYFVWLAALLTAAPWWPALWPTLAAPLLYLQTRTGYVPLWVGFTLYGGFAILALGDLARRGIHAADRFP